VSLQQARKAAQATRDAISTGDDPQAIKHEARQATDKRRTFGQVVDKYLTAFEKGWKNKKHGNQ